MKRNCQLSLLIAILLLPASLLSQVKISTDFDTGSIGSYRLVDSVWILRTPEDSLLTLSLEIDSRYDPLNPVDTSLKPSARWYHFRLEGVKNKNLFIKINNSEVIRPFYSYDGINYQRFDQSENRFKNSINKYFTRDTVYISHFIPYTLERYKNKMDDWEQNPYVTRSVIGQSTLGKPIEMLTITSPAGNSDKKRVWIHGRSHPSEAPSSWHLEAMTDYILSDAPLAIEMRENAIFYIVPIINPDGVHGGYSRSSSTGVNIEINWDRPDSTTMPEIKSLKNALRQVTAEAPLDLLLNMHSQISSSITYWLHTAESTNDYFFKRQMLLSALTITHTPYYRPEDQMFSGVAPRYVEGWIWDRFKDTTVAITFETPYTYYNQDSTGEWVSLKNLKDLGHSSILAISDLLDLSLGNRVMIDAGEQRVNNRWKRVTLNDRIFFGENYYEAKREGARIRYKGHLPEGEYILYRWIAGPLEEDYPPDQNIWKEEAYVIQKRDGNFRYTLKASEEGEIADAIMLVRQ